MSEQSLVLLRLCLLALVYLVFLRVLRAVWVELRAEQGLTIPKVVRGPRTARDPRTAKGPRFATRTEANQANPDAGEAQIRRTRPRRRREQAGELLLVAPPALAGKKFALSAETTVGRAPGCGVQIDDVRVSKLHARLFWHEEAWYLEDLGSTNGTQLDGEIVAEPTRIKRGARVQIAEIELVLT